MSSKPHKTPQAPSTSNFIRQIVEADLAAKKHASVRTRFPPEPNGYLHFGHAKSICLNFGLAQQYGGVCHLRFDDTNPTKEEQEYVDSIKEMVKWLGFDWGRHEYYASDYFEKLYSFAEALAERGHAYVDSLSADDIREFRGTLTEHGRESPYRNRPAAESLRLLREMREGKHADGTHVLRAKIDMRSPNINLRDPVMYRIRHAEHHRTGSKWCIYPTYDWAHGLSDAIEGITHSICTLEFEDHRPLYDWFNERVAEAGLIERPLPRQIEFARLNLTYVLLSKRKLIQLVEEKHVDGWDDPRMPTLAGARRRGYTPEGFRLFAERIGVAKADSWIPFEELESCMREHLNEVAPRRMAVLDPVKLAIENYPEGKEELCDVPNHPQKPDWGRRQVPFSRELWIEKEDFEEVPPKGYFRLFPGNEVRLRYGYVVKCIGMENGVVRCTYRPDSKSGTPGADKYKVKGNIHWVSATHAHAAEVRLYDRLFKTEHPEGTADLNPGSMKVIRAQLEPSLRDAGSGERFQFERHGYFVRDAAHGAFNRTVTLRESWGK
ncbi:MAG: glutamine--tRNA ligase [Betaproteobacteria bacterium RIFCSPHIGHO2_12_FULL_69_13]|nr:MAG: glutamine--tRNA ligase [Betaproteobacteria bacterium RIFCSPHIGHO2_12_FULL_69_13]OGA67208.1 MAG: glutamine--tRNA ligase [Betaproteobacteria bacterium RIFCSPLOWO2_12_FULL_68_20]